MGWIALGAQPAFGQDEPPAPAEDKAAPAPTPGPDAAAPAAADKAAAQPAAPASSASDAQELKLRGLEERVNELKEKISVSCSCRRP